jgi:hypothetical protein
MKELIGDVKQGSAKVYDEVKRGIDQGKALPNWAERQDQEELSCQASNRTVANEDVQRR